MSTWQTCPYKTELRRYKRDIDELQAQGVTHEGGLRRAFGRLLAETARRNDWTLIEEENAVSSTTGGLIQLDGMLRNSHGLPRGFWEAKDSNDDLDAEIKVKRAKGYPLNNTIFEDTRTAVLYQERREVMRVDMRRQARLCHLLVRFYEYSPEPFDDFNEAVARFMDQVPQIADDLDGKIDDAYREGGEFRQAYDKFQDLCRRALNPKTDYVTVKEMLVQHMLTERVIRKVFDEDFVRHNAIAAEVEKVIDVLTRKEFNRADFLGPLENYYKAIEASAGDLRERPDFIDTVYERFFQGFSVRVADTHGIVYTPREIVDFMCSAVQEALKQEFGLNLGDDGIKVIDPCTGTGKYVVSMIDRVANDNPRELRDFYRKRLFANEVLLMPYYIASLRIEWLYHHSTGSHEPFRGLSLVDTLDMGRAELADHEYLNEENAQRIAKQWDAPINVVIGNLPYNVGQRDENENNRNRPYPFIEKRIRETYVDDSCATLRTQLYDAYVKFFRWAIDRLEDRDGIVCFVSNNSFVEGYAFDGFRKHLLQDFTRVWHLDLAGNIRKGRGEGGNVFGNRSGVGIGITLALRNKAHSECRLFYHRVADGLGTAAKLEQLVTWAATRGSLLQNVPWRELTPDSRFTWLRSANAAEFLGFTPLGMKKARLKHCANALPGETVFDRYTAGIKTNRDAVVYDFDRSTLADRMDKFIDAYNADVDRYKRKEPADVDAFVNPAIKWDGTLKGHLRKQRDTRFETSHIRKSLYRPFTMRHLYFDRLLINSVYLQYLFFPTTCAELENIVIAIPGVGNRRGFGCFATNRIIALDLAFEKVQCFPLYTYDADGSNRRENITEWAVKQFHRHYGDDSIRRRDIFNYVYGLLHHPGYRDGHAVSLRRELPRIPLVPDFAAFRNAGRELMRLHLDYESIEPFDLEYESSGARIDWRVAKMAPGKKTPAPEGGYKIFESLKYNDTLTLRGIPPAAFRYRLGPRSALEWIIDQYQVKNRSGIRSDPNA